MPCMTDPVVGAVASGAAQAANKAMKSGPMETAAILEAAKGSKELEYAGKQRAYRIAVREAFISKLFSPIARMVNMRADYFDGDGFAEDMARKTRHLDESEIVAPRANIAAQAVQGLGFSLDEIDLKEMYLNLLATASDSSRSNQAHPAFAEIIRQLTSEEAACLGLILSPKAVPMVRLHRSSGRSEGNAIVVNHFIDVKKLGIHVESPQQFSTWVDNWVRLGLVYVVFDRYLTAENSYSWVEADPFYTSLSKALQDTERPEGDEYVLGFDRGYMQQTDFGGQFYGAVMDFEAPPEGFTKEEPRGTSGQE